MSVLDRSGDGCTAPLPQKIKLPGSRVLTIRRESPGDAVGIAALYDRLSADDTYNRFFSGQRPPDRFVARMTAVYERGGVGLVAVFDEGPGRERVVGEAAYERLADGDGELGITVDPDFRGWLGPYLLDALVEQARARGVRNIQAEVLITNQRMLALLRSRGVVVMDHQYSPSTVRVAIGAAEGTPGWPSRAGHPRLLVEAPGAHWRHADEMARHGFQVMACPGPRRGGPRCPALAGHPCPLAEGADVIVMADHSDEDEMARLPEVHRRLHPTVPVCIIATGGDGGGPDGGTSPAGGMPAGGVPAGEVPAGGVPAGEAPAGGVPAGDVSPRITVPDGDGPAVARFLQRLLPPPAGG